MNNMAQRLPVLYNKKPCYDIVFQQSFDGLWEELAELGAADKRLCIVTDSTVDGLYAAQILKFLEGKCRKAVKYVFPAGEEHKNLDTVKDILKFFGSEEGQRIQGESGAAIPAYQGLEDTWAGCFAEYPINIQCFIEMFEYSIQSVNNASRPEWKSKVNDELLKIYAGTEDIDTGLQKMQDIVDQASAG